MRGLSIPKNHLFMPGVDQKELFDQPLLLFIFLRINLFRAALTRLAGKLA
jgi:hypothetical protein